MHLREHPPISLKDSFDAMYVLGCFRRLLRMPINLDVLWRVTTPRVSAHLEKERENIGPSTPLSHSFDHLSFSAFEKLPPERSEI